MNTNKQEFKNINSEEYNTKVNKVIKRIQKDFIEATSDDIKLSLQDLQNILNKKSTLHAIEVKYTGEDLKSLKFLLQDLSLNMQSLGKILSVLISFRMHTDYPIAKLSKVIKSIYEKINYESDFIWGTVTDNSLDKDLIIINRLFAECK